MTRRDFLNISVLTFGLSNLDLFALPNENVSIKVLTGRQEPVLVGKNERLLKQVSVDFKKMQQAALKSKIQLFSTSSYRGFEHQLRIWNAKYDRYVEKGLKGEEIISKIIEYSAFPGASRHHWGTDLDIYDISVMQPKDPLNPIHYSKGGIYEKMYSWMQENSYKFGFYEVYTNNSSRSGFKFEPWHYSYKESSVPFLREFVKADFKKDLFSTKIKGHELIDTKFWEIYLEKYVKGINPILL
ncbi:MAG: M15 family metallopeptidase [Cytophagales bacterium]